MGKKALLAVTETTLGQGFSDDYNTRGYIDASMVNSTQTGSARGGIKVFVNGSTSGAGSALIDAINAISASDTSITEINIVAENAKTVGNFVYVYDANLTIWIDWVALTVQWQGMWRQGPVEQLNKNIEKPGYSVYQGSQAIEALGSNVTISALKGSAGNHGGLSLYLETGPNRNILKLPIFSRFSYSSWTNPNARPSLNSYTITTDDGINVTATPEPAPETPVAEEVSGIKISELNAADSLDDTDLFVLSRDDPAGDAYDSSKNVTLAKLAQSIGVTAAYNTGFLDTHEGVVVENGATLTITHNLGTVDLLVKIFAAKDADGTGNMELQWQTGDLDSTDGYGAQVVEMEPNYITLQLGISGLLFLNSSGVDSAPGDPGGRSYSPGGVGGRWNFIKVLCVKVS